MASFSGCEDSGNGSGNGSGSGELGPPVKIELDYWAGAAYETKLHLDTLSILKPNLKKLGMQVSEQGSEIMTGLGYAYNDNRKKLWDASLWGHGADPARIDPDPFLRRQAIDQAGPDGNGNVGNYASCEFSKYAIGQRFAPSEDKRRKWVNKAQQIASNDKAVVPLSPMLAFGGTRNTVDVKSLGSIGVNSMNPVFLMDSTPKNKDTLIGDIRPHLIEDLNPLTTGDIGGWVPFMRMLWSPLIAYNPDLELEPILAKELPTYSDGGKKLTVKLRDNLKFHNGDNLTAEDVKFTLEFAKQHYDKFPKGGGDPGFDSVSVVDDTTLELTFPRPNPTFKTAWLPRWGILHKPSMKDSGAVEAPSEWSPSPDQIVGSGPLKITSFTSSQSIAFGPTDVKHPLRNPEHTVVLQGYGDATTATRALLSGNLDVAINISGGNIETIKNEGGDNIKIHATTTHGIFLLYVSTHMAPGKFPAIRDALGTVIDRKSINEVAFNGENEMETHATLFNKNHPWRAPDDMLYQFTDKLSGDLEAAKQKLKDAGFGWDDDGVLHYPPDANLDDLWPAGEFPTKDDGFPCSDKDGKYIGDLPEEASKGGSN